MQKGRMHRICEPGLFDRAPTIDIVETEHGFILMVNDVKPLMLNRMHDETETDMIAYMDDNEAVYLGNKAEFGLHQGTKCIHKSIYPRANTNPQEYKCSKCGEFCTEQEYLATNPRHAYTEIIDNPKK